MIKRSILAILFLWGLAVYNFAQALFFDGILSFRDLARYFYPLRSFTIDCLKSWIVPLWNPYIFCGTPHLALQQSVIFYPLSIIYYLFPFDLAFNLFLVCHIALAGVFVYLLSKRWHFHESASILSAILFMFSGYVISMINLATTLSSCIWLPLILLFFDKALCENKLKHVLMTSVFLAVMFLGGEPSIFYSALWVLLFYSIFFWMNNRSRHRLRKVVSFYLIASIAGAALSSVQLIPFLELMSHSDRTIASQAYDNLTRWSLPVRETFDFIIPFLTRTDFSKESYWREQNWVIVIYTGVFALLLIIISSLFSKEWRTKYLLFIGAFFLLISYGNHTPFYYLLYKFVPGFQYVRYPVRFLYVTTFAISVLSGAGFHIYVDARKRSDQRMAKLFRYLLFLLFLFSLVFLIIHLYRDVLINAVYDFTARMALDAEKKGGVLFGILAAMSNMGRFSGFLVAGGILLYLGLKIKIRQGILSFAFISIVIADLFSGMPGIQITLDAGAFHSSTPNIEYLKKDSSYFRFMTAPQTRDLTSFVECRTFAAGIEGLKDTLTAEWPMMYGLFDAYGYDSIRLARYINLMTLVDTSPDISDTRIPDLLNIKYIASLKEIASSGYKLVNKGIAYLYENTNVLPRAFLTSSFRVAKTEEEVAGRFKDKDFDPAKEVILEEEPDINGSRVREFAGSRVRGFASSRVRGFASSQEEKVEIVKYSPNEVVIKAAVYSPKFLVLSDTYYPGWKAYIDGKLSKLYRAYYVIRAVHLENGDHVVRFVFDPFSFKLGASITIATLIFIFSYIVIIRK